MSLLGSYLLFVTLELSSAVSFGQSVFEGNVIAANGKPVIGAKVVLSQQGHRVGEAVVADDGTFAINFNGDGAYEITVGIDSLRKRTIINIPYGAKKRYYSLKVVENRIQVSKIDLAAYKEMNLRNRRDM